MSYNSGRARSLREGGTSMVAVVVFAAGAAIPLSGVRAQSSGAQGPFVPWTGGMGITESMGTILARDRLNPSRPRIYEADERGMPDRTRLRNDPRSPAAPQWPWNLQGPNNPTLLHARGGDIDSPQMIGLNWQGASLSETGALPPDTDGAVGPTQVVVYINGRIKFFNKTTGAATFNTGDSSFFASVSGGAGLSDTNVRYDPTSQRWFLTVITTSTPNSMLIARSSGPTITNTSSFTFFSFRQDLVAPTGNSGQFADYPSLGVDANALYIGCNMFGSSFAGCSAWVVKKSSIMGSGPIQATAFRNIVSGASGAGPYSPRGVNNDDPAATEGYFIGSNNSSFGLLELRRVSNPGGTPSISANIPITVPSTTNPLSGSPASGSSPGPDALDDRLFSAQIHRDRTTGQRYLLTAHNIQVNASGVASGSGGRNGSRWYQIGNVTGTPTLVQSGTLFDPAATTPFSYWMPSIAMSGQGHMAIGTSKSSSTTFIACAAGGRLASDPSGSTEAATQIIAGAAAYQQAPGGRQRWGDYSMTFVDPSDDQSIWTFQEYANGTNSYGVRVTRLLAPPPATPTVAQPSLVVIGQSNLDVAVTGGSSGGSGFYDTEPGLNRIQASVSGGVIVNSVSYTDPTHITVNVTVPGSAALGPQTIMVTNPDGQSSASALGIINVGSGGPICPTVTQQPSDASPCSGGQAQFTAAFNAFPQPTYQWQKDNVPISDGGHVSGSATATLTISPATLADDGVYTCMATNTCGSATSNGATLDVNAGPNIQMQPQSQTVPLGSPVTFSVSSPNADLYQWQNDSGFIPGATSPTYHIDSVQPSDEGTYSVVLSNSCGFVTSQPATLTIGSPCYANCDNSTTQPILNVNDFICFQSRFAAGDAYANCDGSTTPPVLNVNDFICFQSQFAGGCP